MQPTAIITLTLIVINCLVSFRGLKSESFFERFLFRVDEVLKGKQYYRLITSGFLHISWMHLILNMVSLYFFGSLLELALGTFPFLAIYFAGMLGGKMLALFIHRNHGDYSSVGASGAICGVIFASIAIFPGFSVGLFLLPISMPGWLFGVLYVLYSIYGIKSKFDNIGHEAHLGGALVGMYVALMFEPTAITNNFITIIIVSAPAMAFIYLIVKRPYVLFIDNFYYKQHHNATLEDRYNIAKKMKQDEVDAILDKIHRKGINSLTKAERQQLDEYSSSQ